LASAGRRPRSAALHPVEALAEAGTLTGPLPLAGPLTGPEFVAGNRRAFLGAQLIIFPVKIKFCGPENLGVF
jgi:hypothetical protein